MNSIKHLLASVLCSLLFDMWCRAMSVACVPRSREGSVDVGWIPVYGIP